MAKGSPQSVLGVASLAVGAVLLATRFVPIEAAPAWLLGIGLALAAAAILQRSYLALLFGTVLLGLGGGMVLGDRSVADLALGTWILLGLATAMVSFWLLAWLLKLQRSLWALGLGAVLAAVAGVRAVNRFELVPPEFVMGVRTWWPLALVVIGLWLLIRGRR